MRKYHSVSPNISFPESEQEILKFWDQEQVFQKSLDQTAAGPFYSFYDGPPFATGLPHYGHILAGVLKDIIPRYWTMRGYHVPRYFGWDCHGVPVEYELNKELQIKDNLQVREMGVANYNESCRKIVNRFTHEWEKTVRRVGRWVDMKNDYKTMDLTFMQSVWWVFQQIWEKGLIYEGFKVVPFSTGLATPLSNFEANQNYQMVQDPSITVRMKLDDQNRYFLAWTTTPWTLPSHMALAVGTDIDYVAVSDGQDEYILAEALLPSYQKQFQNAEILERFLGRDLVGKTYEPIYSYFLSEKPNGAFRVIASDHVTTETGTGIVHMAPAFGEDDFFACQKARIPLVNPVDEDGRFTDEVGPLKGQKVKDTDKRIIADLKKDGRLFDQGTINHSFPFCERTDTPIIYKAVSSWFVNVEKIKDQIVQNNQTTSWVPEALRDGRFGNWLENARDWAISRNRFWGTPLPIWKNEEGEVLCIGSAQELAKLSGQEVTDLHIHFVDSIEIPSPTGKSPLKRIQGVLDCWFESGSMPVAQWGYPFVEERKENFEKGFPADFIAEGLDQTRGWFYTLMVISTALFDRPAFKHVVVNGIILAEDGRKMSKRLKNYPDPMEVLDRHGADALRLYLIDSPVVRAQDLKFSEKGVAEITRKILLRWWNAYSFFVSYANIDAFQPKGGFNQSPNILDQWILSRLTSLTQHTNREMEAYRLYNVVPSLLQFIEDLTNTYIRFNRPHFWQEGMPEDKRLAYETLYHVLMELSRLMAPFTPFISETTFQNLKSAQNALSVHLEPFPEAKTLETNPNLEAAVARMSQLCLMGRNLRETLGIKTKIPLKQIRIIHRDPQLLDDLKRLESYFTDELNVRSVVYDSDEDAHVQVSTKANFPRLGKRLGKKMKLIAGAIQKLPLEKILEMETGKSLQVEGEEITLEDVEIRRAPKKQSDSFITSQDFSIELDPSIDPDQIQEGLAREVVRRVQMARKNADFNLDNRIQLELACSGPLQEAVRAFEETIRGETLATQLTLTESPTGEYSETFDIDGEPLQVGVQRV